MSTDRKPINVFSELRGSTHQQENPGHFKQSSITPQRSGRISSSPHSSACDFHSTTQASPDDRGPTVSNFDGFNGISPGGRSPVGNRASSCGCVISASGDSSGRTDNTTSPENRNNCGEHPISTSSPTRSCLCSHKGDVYESSPSASGKGSSNYDAQGEYRQSDRVYVQFESPLHSGQVSAGATITNQQLRRSIRKRVPTYQRDEVFEWNFRGRTPRPQKSSARVESSTRGP